MLYSIMAVSQFIREYTTGHQLRGRPPCSRPFGNGQSGERHRAHARKCKRALRGIVTGEASWASGWMDYDLRARERSPFSGIHSDGVLYAHENIHTHT